MTCAIIPVPAPSCGVGPCSDAKLFNAANGAVEQNFSFLQSRFGSFDISYFNLWRNENGNLTPKDFGLGINWFAAQFAQLSEHNDGSVSVVFSPARTGGMWLCGR